FARLSSIWAFSPYTAQTRYLNIMFFALVHSFGVTQYVENRDDFEKITSIYPISVAIIGLSQFLVSSPSEWFGGFFGSALGNNNSNTFGIIMMYTVIMSFYKAYSLSKRRWYIIFAFAFLCCVLSSSRKVFIVALICILIIMLLSKDKKFRLLHLLISFIIIIFGFFLIFETDSLYEIIGWRLENFFKYNTGEDVMEGSLPMRRFAIEFAKQLFKNKPILGYGYANCSLLMSEMTYVKNAIYAHNNYYELLADLGIVGFIIYYSSHIYIGVRLIAKYFRENFSTVVLLPIILLTAKLVCDYASVTMLDPYAQTILAISFSGIFINTSLQERQFYYEQESER
ncbi:MAG: O-antigen ligase family protein, partial [Clostridia bacterium]|nr:O-antigen ligase family protein [Clostridia bacterium]